MKKEKPNHHAPENKSTDRAPYESPAIVYEGLITTRAGTPVSIKDNVTGDTGAGAEDIFSVD